MSASSSPNKKKPSQKQPVATTATSGQTAKSYEQQGLQPDLVELEHLRTVETEVRREREVSESLQADVTMLTNQLQRSDETNRGLEKVRLEQASNITMLERVRGEQAVHITSLEQVRI